VTDEGTDLLLTKATVRICPVCLEQVEPDPDGDVSCWHYGTSVEALEVDAYPFLDQLRSKRALALFRLQTDIREHEFAEAEKRWYEGLDVAGRFWEDSRRKRVAREQRKAWEERIAAARPFDRTMMRLMDAWQSDLERSLFSSSPLLDWIRHPWPKPDALDVWLAEDGPMPEVEAALS
jgi:hypothetical protein